MLTYLVPLTTTGATIKSIDATIINSNQSDVHIWCSSAIQFSSQVSNCDYVTLPANQVLAMPNMNSINDVLFRAVSGTANLNVIVYNAIG
jgi:hypothetical protein